MSRSWRGRARGAQGSDGELLWDSRDGRGFWLPRTGRGKQLSRRIRRRKSSAAAERNAAEWGDESEDDKLRVWPTDPAQAFRDTWLFERHDGWYEDWLNGICGISGREWCDTYDESQRCCCADYAVAHAMGVLN